MTGTAPLDFGQLFARNAPPSRPLGTVRRGTYDFAVAYPDPASIPVDELVNELRDALAEEGEDLAEVQQFQIGPSVVLEQLG